jgi:hypothetical protein
MKTAPASRRRKLFSLKSHTNQNHSFFPQKQHASLSSVFEKILLLINEWWLSSDGGDEERDKQRCG